MTPPGPGPTLRHTFRYRTEAFLTPGAEVELNQADSHHCNRVVRRAVGDRIELIGADGRLWEAEIITLQPRVMVTAHTSRAAPPVHELTLYLGLLDSARLDLVVEKAAELGVSELTVMSCERLRRHPEPSAWQRRQARLERVAAAAARQCGRGHVMAIRGLVPFATAVMQTAQGRGLLIDPRAVSPLYPALAGGGAAALLVGPEAGFSPSEVAQAEAAGIGVHHLGPAVLRAETAALAAVVLAAQQLGGLG